MVPALAAEERISVGLSEPEREFRSRNNRGMLLKIVPLTATGLRENPRLCHTGNKCWVPHVKPCFGLSGIMALDLPLPIRHVSPRDLEMIF